MWKRSRRAILHKVKPTPPPSPPIPSQTRAREPGWLLYSLSLDAGLSFLRLVPEAASGPFIVFRWNHDPPRRDARRWSPANSISQPRVFSPQPFSNAFYAAIARLVAVGSFAVLRRRDVKPDGLNWASWNICENQTISTRICPHFIVPPLKENNRECTSARIKNIFCTTF